MLILSVRLAGDCSHTECRLITPGCCYSKLQRNPNLAKVLDRILGVQVRYGDEMDQDTKVGSILNSPIRRQFPYTVMPTAHMVGI